MKHLLLLAIAIFSFQCSEDLDPITLNASQFVEVVKNNEYDADVLPPFKADDITILLTGAQNNQQVSTFVVNPISSYRQASFTLTESMLWTIEAIRLDSDPDDNLLPLPSLAPKLRKRDAQDNLVFATEEDYVLAYEAYNDWWNDQATPSFEEKKKVNPLENLNLFWF